MKIKKLLIISLILGLSSSMVFADWIVPVTALPQKSRAFINSTFPGVQIWKVERDGGKFEVKLSNGVDIDFYMNGDWKDIDGEWVTIPFSVLPASVANTVKQTYPQAEIWMVEMEHYNVYEVKMSNFMELYIDINGNLLYQKWDD